MKPTSQWKTLDEELPEDGKLFIAKDKDGEHYFVTFILDDYNRGHFEATLLDQTFNIKPRSIAKWAPMPE